MNSNGRSRGCFEPPTPEEVASFPRCATCGGIYPIECPPHVCPECGLSLAMHTSAGRSGYNRYCDSVLLEGL